MTVPLIPEGLEPLGVWDSAVDSIIKTLERQEAQR